MNKICNICQVKKEVSHFHKKERGLYGVSTRCKPCQKAYAQEWYASNRHRISLRNKVSYMARKLAR